MTFEEYDKIMQIVLGVQYFDKQYLAHGSFGQGFDACKGNLIDELTNKLWPYIDKEDLENGKNG